MNNNDNDKKCIELCKLLENISLENIDLNNEIDKLTDKIKYMKTYDHKCIYHRTHDICNLYNCRGINLLNSKFNKPEFIFV